MKSSTTPKIAKGYLDFKKLKRKINPCFEEESEPLE
jgi:hypothetical protein